jgi:hypothetical protein
VSPNEDWTSSRSEPALKTNHPTYVRIQNLHARKYKVDGYNTGCHAAFGLNPIVVVSLPTLDYAGRAIKHPRFDLSARDVRAQPQVGLIAEMVLPGSAKFRVGPSLAALRNEVYRGRLALCNEKTGDDITGSSTKPSVSLISRRNFFNC